MRTSHPGRAQSILRFPESRRLHVALLMESRSLHEQPLRDLLSRLIVDAKMGDSDDTFQSV